MATTSSTSASSVSQGGSVAAVPQPTEAQQRVLERIAAQRDRLHARRAARMQAMALARHEQGLGGTDESLVLRAGRRCDGSCCGRRGATPPHSVGRGGVAAVDAVASLAVPVSAHE
jgi:hypothetical protein